MRVVFFSGDDVFKWYSCKLSTMDTPEQTANLASASRSRADADSYAALQDVAPQTVRMRIPTGHQPAPSEGSTVFRTGSASLDAEYEVLDKIGGGGMGIVFLARDRKLGRFVAIKRLNASSLESDPLRDRFMREARAVASLNHIHIVHLYSLGEDEQGPFIVMEYVPGPRPAADETLTAAPFSLADRVHREGPIPLDAALDMITKIGRAISYAHGRDVIHRDLKPSNILLDSSGEPKVVDFGLARMSEASARPLTMPGEKMLSLGYGAPEQESDASLSDERVDVYGLGALLYFCITGKNPRYFRQNDVPEVIRMSIVKALETDRENRWETVDAFLMSLALVRSPEHAKLSSAKPTWRCKWCETVNPVVIRYCGKCGWDGGVSCAECGSELRYGIQFCGVCGADAKAYEQASDLLRELRQHREARDFGFILQKEKQIASFNPMGMNGRKLVDRVNELGQEAGAALRRRVALSDAIDRELKVHNYEQVRDHINEYNRLSQEPGFEDIADMLDTLILDRDLARLREAARKDQWEYTARNARQMLEGLRMGHAEIETLLRRADRQLLMRQLIRRAGLVVLVFCLYLVSAAPVYRIMGRPSGGIFDIFYAPAAYVQCSTVFHVPLAAYARSLGAAAMFGDSP